jgi:hypothetical protein
MDESQTTSSEISTRYSFNKSEALALAKLRRMFGATGFSCSPARHNPMHKNPMSSDLAKNPINLRLGGEI